MGVSSRRWRCASSASAKAMAKPITMAIAVSAMCWRTAGHRTLLQLSCTQFQQKPLFWRPPESPPPPKSGMTVWAMIMPAAQGAGDQVDRDHAALASGPVDDDALLAA